MVKIIVSGLKPEEHMFKESLEELCLATGEKLETHVKFSPDDELHLQIKSHVEGKKKRYDAKARLTARGKTYSVKDPDTDYHREVWDLNLAVREALQELEKVVEKHARNPQLKGLTEDEALEKRAKQMPE